MWFVSWGGGGGGGGGGFGGVVVCESVVLVRLKPSLMRDHSHQRWRVAARGSYTRIKLGGPQAAIAWGDC